MNLEILDIVIIAAYIILINAIGIYFSRYKNMDDYFLGGRSIPWIVACFSIVATETSTVTFISIPGFAYNNGLLFLQIVFGYMVGRVLVAYILIPKYFGGNFETVYEYLENRFGIRSRRILSVVFQITRLLADSFRLVLTAIPLTLLTGWSPWFSLLVIGLATFLYTFYGGFRSVVIVDSIQLALYLGCAVAGIYIAADLMGMSIPEAIRAIPDEKLSMINSGTGSGIKGFFSSLNIFAGIIGGAFLSFASHGTDHLLVQRALACKNESAAKKAMIVSGIFILIQFSVFMLFGIFLYMFFQGKIFSSPDSIMPYFIVNHPGAGVRGIMLAGIFAAAMSSLSSSINSLSSSTSVDILRIDRRDLSDKKKIALSRLISLAWTLALVGMALFFSDIEKSIIEVVLSIASVPYGGMLGIFLMGRFMPHLKENAVLIGMTAGIGVNAVIVFSGIVHWLWLVLIGLMVSVITAYLVDRIKK
jgi:SSS family transporter